MSKDQKKHVIAARIILWIALVFVFFIIIWLLSKLIFNIFINTDYPSLPYTIKYTVSKPDKKGKYVSTTQKISSSKLVKDDTVYFNFTSVANDCGCKVTGDEERIRYIFEKGEVTFFTDSTLVYVGDEPVILDVPVYLADGDVYVPASFGEYMYGLKVEFRNKTLKIEYDPTQVRPANGAPVDKPTPVTVKE